jgi:hypothetical protein
MRVAEVHGVVVMVDGRPEDVSLVARCAGLTLLMELLGVVLHRLEHGRVEAGLEVIEHCHWGLVGVDENGGVGRAGGGGDAGVIALAQSTTMTNLTSLDLTANDIGPEGVKALCISPVVSKLTSLRLSDNDHIGSSLAAALAAPSSALYSLLELHIRNTSMNEKDMLQLLATPYLDQLDVLDVWYFMNNAYSAVNAAYYTRFDDRF